MGDTFRKFISIVCVLALLTGLVPSAALAAPDGTEAARAAEPVSVTADQKSGEPAADRSGSFSPKTGVFTADSWTKLQDRIIEAPSESTIRLTNDAIAGSSDGPLMIPDKQLTIDLNGYKIDRNLTDPVNYGYVISASGHSNHTVTFTGTGTITGGRNTGNGGGIYVNGINLALKDSVSVTGNTAANGGGIYIGGECTLYLYNSSSVTGNTAANGGGVYIDGFYFDIHDSSSITKNTATSDGGGVYAYSGELRLYGGSISDNNSDARSKGIYQTGGSNSTLLTLPNGSTAKVTDSVYLPTDSIITVEGTPSAEACIHVTTQTTPTPETSLIIAMSSASYDCSSNFVIDNPPINSELVYENPNVRLRVFEVTTWTQLQEALNRGGFLQSDGSRLIRLTQNITAEGTDEALVFNYSGNHPVILDLNGCAINRGLNTRTENGNVLTVSGGTLTIRDSSTEKTGKIRGGDNEGEGGGVRVLGGTLTMEGGSITGNYAASGGGGVYVYGGIFNMEGGSVEDNMARTYGSGIYVIEGSANIKGSVISGNSAGDTNLHGGGIFVGGGGNLTIEGSEIKYHRALYGGGVYVAARGSATMTSGSISGNTATSDGGGIYVEPDGSATINGGSIQSNTAMNNGGGILIESGSLDLKGGTISDNTANQKGTGIYQDGSLTLSEGAELNVTDSVYLPTDKFITVNSIPTEPVHVQLESTATLTNPVVIAHSETDCRGIFVIDSKQPNTELFYDGADHAVKLRLTPVVTTWAELQAALNNGGVPETTGEETVNMIRLGGNITAADNESALVFNYTGHPVALDLNGCEINRGLSTSTENGNVLTVTDGELILRDSAATGSITGGYNENGNNTGYGGGIYMSGGALTLSGVTVTGNHANYGGGVFVKSGTLTMQNSHVNDNTASSNGGGIYVDPDGALVLGNGSDITSNTATSNGGGVYVYKGNIVLSGGSIKNNDSQNGGGVYLNAAQMQLSGGTIWGNSSYNDNYRGVYPDGNSSLTLSNGSAITADCIYLPENKKLTVAGAPAGGSIIHVTTQTAPTPDASVVIADSEEDCRSSFVVDNQPHTRLVWENNEIRVEYRSTVMTWAELQEELDAGGTREYAESEAIYIIRLGDNIAAGPNDTALVFNYTDHPVTLDLNGYVINRNLSAPVMDGYVLLVNGGNLRITGNSGSIYGGSNSGTNGGGISINRGSVTLAGGASIGMESWKEGNSATLGGGVYVGSNGSFTMDGGSIEANSADRGGAVYVNGGNFTMSRGSIRGNIVKDVNANSVIHAARGSTVVLKGGVIEDNTCTASTITNSKISLNATLTLSDDPEVAASLVVKNSIDLTGGKTITIDAPLKPGDTISILADTPAYGNFVKIADSAYDCTSYLTIENQPYAKLTHESNEIRLRDGRVTTWTELQAALDNGGTREYAESEDIYIIRLGGNIAAGLDDTALEFDYTAHPVILDLCGYSIDRNLSTTTGNDNVLTVTNGELILRDSAATGSITGGYSTQNAGGGVRVLGGTFTMEGGSITGNTAKDVNGGGVYVTTGGTFKLKGGSITGNGAFNCKGGGVYVNGGSFKVSGSPSVTGNFDDTQGPSNVYLANNCVISLEGALTDDASIHVAAEQDGPITDASYKKYHDGVVSPAFFTLDGGGRFYLNTEGCLCAERSHHLPEQPEWTWAEDLTNATATMRCQSCGQELWKETADKVTFEHDEVLSSILYAAATVTHDNTPYKGRQLMTDRLVYVKEVGPSIDENGTYRSGMKEHFRINAGNKAYYFKSIQGHAGEQCELEDLVWNRFIISATNQNTGIIQKYVDGVSSGKTQIDLPSRIENTVGQETDFVPLKILGDGVNAFYTRDISPSTPEDHVEITDRASITNVGAASFANRSDLTLNLNTTEAITIAGNAFGNSGNVTINALHVTSPITIADGAFTGCENATIRTLHASGLQLGEHDDAKGRYTVEMQDGHSYNATAKWAADYSTADITISCSGCGDTHTFQATNITRTDTETVNPETQVKTYTISITAEGSYNGQTYSVTLNPVPYYEVTVQGTEGTLRLPRARNTDNTDFADYAMFTVTQDMLDPLHPPAGAVLDGLTDGSGTCHAGDKVTITRNTDFSASWRSTWAKVQTALNDSETNPVTVTLYSDISPAAEGDSYLHIPSGKSVTLNLGNHTVNRGLSGATDNGYVIRVDGALTLSGNNGTVTGGNNTGDGGGIYVGNGGTLETNNVSITHNHAQNGGGVYMLNVSGAEFNNSSITDNTAAQQGGGLYIGGEASQSDGGILGIAPVAEMAVILNSTVVARNTAGMSAGGVYVNKGEMKIGSDTEIINNTKGGDFNNIDVGSGGVSILGGASGFLLGLPALTAAGITGLPAWAEILIAGGAIALGAVIFDRTKSGTDDDQKRDCEHPEESKRGELKWEESKYTYADEFIWCAKCGRALETPRHEPTITVNETTKVTNYKVSPKYAKSNTSRDVSPYKLIKQANIPEGIDTSKISSELGDKEELIAHRRHEEKTEQLGNSPWTFKTNEGLKFNDWLHGNDKVTSVTFSGNDDKETITVKVNWQLPYGYTPNDSAEDRVQGDHPLKPDSDENPIYVDKGTEKTVKENKWTRKAYSFSTWKQPSSVSIEKEGGEYKLVYSYDDEDKTKKAGDKITIDLPVMLRAEWQSKWAALAANLEKDPHSVDMSENVEALSDDKTITVAADNTDTLDLKGKTLDGKSQSGVEHIFDISGTLTVKDSTDEKNGVVKGGKTDKNGAGALVEKTGTLKLESGSIKDNMTVHQDNSDPGHGGGVYVDGDSEHHGSFEMSGGSVKDNKAWHSGGGVYIKEHGSFKMSGGEITGNKAGHAESGSGSSDAKGGGVYVGGSFEVSGKVIIKDNKIGDTASNVYLPEGKTITVSGKLDNDARIHVSMQTPGVITSGLNAKGGDNARGKAENFVSDDENYKVIITDAGEAKLVDKDAKPKFNKARLELGGILRMRFYVELPEGWETGNDRIDFSLKDMEPLSYAYSEYQKDDEGNYFVCPVNAYQMADTITAKYYHGDEEVATYTYTVEQYLRTLMYPSTNEQTAAINLAKATANYGHYIQPYLAATNGWTVGEDYAEMKTFEPIEYHGNPDEGESYKYVFNTTQAYSLKVAKTEFYLTLDSDTLLNVRVYLRNSEGTVTGKVGDKELKQWNRGGNSVVICLEGIPANALGTPYTFECFVDGVKVFDLSISALSIVNLALKNGGASDEERMAFTALYNYAMAAKVYTP